MNNNLIDSLTKYVKSLESEKNEFHFFPSKEGLTYWGEKVELGFSCLAIKSLYMLNIWDKLEEKKRLSWVQYINSFQKNKKDIPVNSFVDEVFIKYNQKFDIRRDIKNIIKESLTLLNIKKYESKKENLSKVFVAESKQAISTLFQVENKNNLPYSSFPKDKIEINDYLNSFNWDKPWNAGAQFASLCVFSSTQMNKSKNEQVLNLTRFIEKKVNKESGLYFENKIPNSVESINGAMKVLTGLEWLEEKIHYPEKIIDYCLDNKPNSEGCDLVDIVYVLSRCSKQTNHKRKQIHNYFYEIEELIMTHYKKDEGGFSYWENRSQTSYYGLPITTGKNIADLHGTTLLIWALALINDFRDDEEKKFNLIKA